MIANGQVTSCSGGRVPQARYLKPSRSRLFWIKNRIAASTADFSIFLRHWRDQLANQRDMRDTLAELELAKLVANASVLSYFKVSSSSFNPIPCLTIYNAAMDSSSVKRLTGHGLCLLANVMMLLANGNPANSAHLKAVQETQYVAVALLARTKRTSKHVVKIGRVTTGVVSSALLCISVYLTPLYQWCLLPGVGMIDLSSTEYLPMVYRSTWNL